MNPMQVQAIDGIGADGLVTDVPRHKRTPRQLSVCTNLRIRDGELATMGELQPAYTTSKQPVFAHPFYLSDDSGGHIFVYADGGVAYVDSTGTELEIHAPGQFIRVDYFDAAQINDIFVLTNGVDMPLQITEDDIRNLRQMVELVNWPTHYRCRMVEAYKSHMVVAGITISSEEQRSMVKWSHPLSPGDQVLYWGHTQLDGPVDDPTLLAGENVLPVAGRNISAIQSLRDNCIVYFDQALWRMSFVGGEYVMAFAKVFEDDGAVGPFAVSSFDGAAIVVGFHDIYTHDGFSKRSLSDRKLTRAFFSQVIVDSELRLAYHNERREIYMLFKSAESDENASNALVYNIDFDAFTLMVIPERNALMMYTGPQFSSSDLTYDEAGQQGLTYDSMADDYYNDLRTKDDNLNFYLLRSTGVLEALDKIPARAYNPGGISGEIAPIDMVALFGSAGDNIKYISRLFPQVDGAADVQFSLGTASHPAEVVDWSGYVNFNAADDEAVDQRASGRYMSLRFKCDGSNKTAWSMSGLELELMVPNAGRR